MREGSVRLDLWATLLILFSIFVLGDIVTTVWLIHNDPSGISNEGNPFGALLYMKYGVIGLFLGKFIFFIPFSLTVLTLERRYAHVDWLCRANEIAILGLLAYSLVVFLNNFVAIIVLEAMKGWPFMLQILPVIRFFIIVFCLSLEVGILGLCGFRSWLRRAEAIAGSILMVVPLLVYEPIYVFLSESPLLLVAYMASLLTILGIALYITDEVIKERAARRTPNV